MANPSKFFSAALEAAETAASKVKKPVPIKKMRELLTQHGASGDELKYIEFDDLVKQNPDAPMSPNSSDWVGMLMRRGILEAAEQDAPALMFPSGDTAVMRYWSNPRTGIMGTGDYEERAGGLRAFHEGQAPQVLAKQLRSLGNTEELRRAYGPSTGYKYGSKYDEDTGNYVGQYYTLQPDWYVPLTPEFRRKLREKGKVPFFKKGGPVFKKAKN